jgi:predicted transcriptional regulator
MDLTNIKAGETLKATMHKRKMTTSDVERISGVPRSNVAKILQGAVQRPPMIIWYGLVLR